MGAYIEDVNEHVQLSVLMDRAQGCTSLSDGSQEFMLHREEEAGDDPKPERVEKCRCPTGSADATNKIGIRYPGNREAGHTITSQLGLLSVSKDARVPRLIEL